MNLKENERRILKELQMNSRLTAAEISRKLDIARTTVNVIINRLEEQVIDTYTVTLRDDIESSMINCYVMISSDPKVLTVHDELAQIPEIKELKSVAGPIDLMAFVQTETHEELDRLLVKIARLDGIENTQTSIVLSSKIKR